MKTVLGILYFCLCIEPSQVVAVYPVCGQPSSNMSGCCMLSQGALRCTEVTCPDGYYNVVSSSTCSDSETSLEDNEVPAQKDTRVPHQGSRGTLVPSLSTTTTQSVSGSSKNDVSANQSDSDAASFKPLTSEAPRHLLESTSQKAPPSPLMAEDNSSNVQTSLSSVTPVTSPHVFCCQCHVSCLTCSDKGPEHCLSCAPGFVWRSTNTTERCSITEYSLNEDKSPSLIIIIILCTCIPIILCSVIILFIYYCRRKRYFLKRAGDWSVSMTSKNTSVLPPDFHRKEELLESNSINDDFGVNTPFMKQEICFHKIKTSDVSLNDSLDSIEPTLSPHKHCLVHQDEDQQIMPLAVEPKYTSDLASTTNAVLSGRRVEDVPRRVESVRALGCEAWKPQPMTELLTSDSMIIFSQLFATEEKNNSTMTNFLFPGNTQAYSELDPKYWEIPGTDESVDFGDTQSVLELCDNYFSLSDFDCKKDISDSTTHFKIMNVSDSSTLSCHSISEKSYCSIGSTPLGLVSIYPLPDSSISSDDERSDSLPYEQRLMSTAYEISRKDKLSLPSPIISPQWQISEDFSRIGGVLEVASSGVCLEVGEGAVDITDKVTIRGAVSTDLTNAYDVLPLPPDEVIVSPITEYFAGFYFRFEKPVRIVLPHFLSSDLPVDLVRVYEFHSENGRIQCCRLQMMNTEDEKTVATGYFFCGSKREIHVFTNHFSGYVCTVCEEACMGYYKPPEVTLRALAKHVLRSNGKREVMVRLDLWDSRFSPDIQQRRHQTEVSIEDRQMVLILERKLKSLDDSPDVGNAEIGARFQFSEEQTTFWTHVSSGGVNVFAIEQRLRVKELYPCRRRRPPYSMKWMLRDAQPIPPQEEFECFIYIGYVDGQIPIGATSFGNDQQTIIFMKSPDFLILPIRRAMKLDEDHPDCTIYHKQPAHGGLAEARPTQIRQSKNTSVKNLASSSESSSLDYQTSSASNSQGCSMLRHESDSGYMREFSDTSSAKSGVSIQHVQSINNLKFYVNCSTPPTRDEALGDLVFRADSSDIQERHSSLRNSVNHNITYPTPASDQ